MLKSIVCSLLLNLTVLSSMVSAEVYRWVDPTGKTAYADDLSKVPPEFRAQAQSADLPKVSKSPAREAPKGMPPSAAVNQTVEIYVTSWCPYCKALESFLTDNSVPFVRYDIEKSSEGARKYREIGRSGVPVIKIGSRVISGFDPEALDFLRRKNP